MEKTYVVCIVDNASKNHPIKNPQPVYGDGGEEIYETTSPIEAMCYAMKMNEYHEPCKYKAFELVEVKFTK
jgi:hypothetical protein